MNQPFAPEAAKSINTEPNLDDSSKMLTKVTVETAVNATLDDHLGYEEYSPKSSYNESNGMDTTHPQPDAQLNF